MNIFILDTDMSKNAQYHVDKHVVKMITEQNQLLCSAYYYTNFIPDHIYKLAYPNHPCTKWVRKSLSNWLWLRSMTLVLCKEYTYRYGRIHKGEIICKSLIIPFLPDIGITPFAQAMPDQYKNSNAVTAYRDYYNNEKRHLFKWKNREIPYWIIK